jgi:hypothetical protein
VSALLVGVWNLWLSCFFCRSPGYFILLSTMVGTVRSGTQKILIKLLLMRVHILGKSEENAKVCCGETHSQSQRCEIVSLSRPSMYCNSPDHLNDRKENQLKQKKKEEEEKAKAVHRVYVSTRHSFRHPRNSNLLPSPQIASSLFLAHNTALVPPYRVLIDTNFINFSLQNKLELVSGMMDCLYAKCEVFVVFGLFPFVGFATDEEGTRYSVCNRLRNGRTRKTGAQIPRRTTVCFPPSFPLP